MKSATAMMTDEVCSVGGWWSVLARTFRSPWGSWMILSDESSSMSIGPRAPPPRSTLPCGEPESADWSGSPPHPRIHLWIETRVSSCRGLGHRVIEFYLVSQSATKHSPGWRANILRDRPRPRWCNSKHGSRCCCPESFTRWRLPEASGGCLADYSGAPRCFRGSSHVGLLRRFFT